MNGNAGSGWKASLRKPELVDFEHWMAQIIKGDSCIGGVDGNPVEPCGAATDDTPPEG